MDWERRRRLVAAIALACLCLVHGLVLLPRASRSVGGSDSSGYFNLARAIVAGRLVEPVENLTRLGFDPSEVHLFIPLGFVPGERPGTMATFYPPGFPLQIVASAIAGWRFGPFLLSPLFAVASTLLTYCVGREIGLRRLSCLASAAALACLPVLNFQALLLMSDTAATAWALATILCALKARRRTAWAAAAGFGFGMGILIRPASAVLLPAVALALPWAGRSWLLFAAGGAPCAVFLGWFNRTSYGSATRTGYGQGGALADFAVANFAPRVGLYLYWIGKMMTPIVPVVAAFALVDRARPLRTRLLLLCWFGAFFILYCFYGPSDAWWYTRYLLPGIPALLLAASLVVEDILTRTRRPVVRRAAAAIAVAIFLGACGAGLDHGRRYRVLEIGKGETVYPETLKWVAPKLPANAVVLVMQFSGAIRAYGGPPFVRWDYLDADNWPGIRKRIEERGFRIYALVFPFEVRDAASRAPGNWTYLGSNRDAGLFRLDP